MAYPDFDLCALYEALDEKRRSRNMSWAAVAREISRIDTGEKRVSSSTITGIKNRSVVEGDGVLQMLIWLPRSPESFIPGFEDANHERYRLIEPERGRILRWDSKALHLALDGRRQALGMSWRDVAQEIGEVTPAVLVNLAKGGRVNFPAVMRVVQWLGRPAAVFTRISDR